MRDNFGSDWVFGAQSSITSVVRASFPSELRMWPLLQTFDFESYIVGGSHLIIVLRDKLAGVPVGCDPKPFPYSDHPLLPVTFHSVEIWQSYLFSKFALRPEDAALILPIHDSGKSDTGEDYKLFSSEEKEVWDLQVRLTVARQKTTIQLTPLSTPPTPVNIYNISGSNARVNTNSMDSSTNIVNHEIQSINHVQEDTGNPRRWVKIISNQWIVSICCGLVVAMILWFVQWFIIPQIQPIKLRIHIQTRSGKVTTLAYRIKAELSHSKYISTVGYDRDFNLAEYNKAYHLTRETKYLVFTNPNNTHAADLIIQQLRRVTPGHFDKGTMRALNPDEVQVFLNNQ